MKRTIKGKVVGHCLGTSKKPIPVKTKDKIRLLHDKGWPSSKIQKKFRSFSIRQIGAVRGWMRRGAY